MSQPTASATDLLPMHIVENVKENPTSKREKKIEQIVNYIVTDLKGNSKLSKNNYGSISRACQLIENLVKKKDKIDKLELVVTVFGKLFPGLSATDIILIKDAVHFVLDSKLIKKVSSRKQLYSYLRKVIISNCLFRDE
jgi:hypothetical protein